jgi:hypothetical protein
MDARDPLPSSEAALLSIYSDHPMHSGDVALLVDPVCMEVAGLADHWDTVLRDNIAWTLRELPVERVVIAIARPGAELRPGDHVLWAELREELLGQVEVAPLVALPAA